MLQTESLVGSRELPTDSGGAWLLGTLNLLGHTKFPGMGHTAPHLQVRLRGGQR